MGRAAIWSMWALAGGCGAGGAHEHEDAGADPCAAEPESEGCPCEEPAVCYAGPAGTLDVGACSEGLRECDGTWGPCVGQTLPVAETCNQVDDDCDGAVDEDVQNDCGNCDDECGTTCIGMECPEPFEPGADTSFGVVLDPDGALRLDGEGLHHDFIWIPETTAGTILKVDTRTKTAIARYRTGSDTDRWLQPSRTTVTRRGDAVVANRGEYSITSVTKIESGDCDAGFDGRLRTSGDPDDLLQWAEPEDWDDECIAWHTRWTDEGDLGAMARAVAVREAAGLDGALEERVWVGLYYQSRFDELDGADGTPTGRSVDVSPVTPYGAAIDRDGFLWASPGCFGEPEGPARVNTDTAELECVGESCAHPTGFCYGIVVDEQGDVWCGGDPWVYRVADDAWELVDLPGDASWAGRADVRNVASDGRGSIWFATPNALYYRVNREDVTDFEAVPLDGLATYSVAIDFDGMIWGIGYYFDEAIVLDPATGASERAIQFQRSYAYSDLTGTQVANATNPFGEYRWVVRACDAEERTSWTELAWEAESGAATSVSFEIRTAPDLGTLGRQPWIYVAADPPDASPVELTAVLDTAGVESDAYLEVRGVLRTEERSESPRLRAVTVEYSCRSPLQ